MNILKYNKTIISIAIAVFIFLAISLHPENLDYWLKFWWMFPVALIISLIVNTAGLSGAALFVPFFIILFPVFATPLSNLQSVKLGLITESFGLSSSALAFIAYGLVDKKLALKSILGALPLVVGGALLSSAIPESILLIMIAAMLIISVLLIKFRKHLSARRKIETQSGHINLAKKSALVKTIADIKGNKYSYSLEPRGFHRRFLGYGLGGFFQGAAGFGIGEMGIISMIMTKIPIRVAIGTSHLIVAATAIAASLIHFLKTSPGQAPILWNILIFSIPAVVIGGQLAPHVAAKLSTRLLEHFISALFIVIAITLLILAIK